jgi:hypothetical protein
MNVYTACTIALLIGCLAGYVHGRRWYVVSSSVRQVFRRRALALRQKPGWTCMVRWCLNEAKFEGRYGCYCDAVVRGGRITTTRRCPC